MEEWKSIIIKEIEYPYEVSNFGKVRNSKMKELKPIINNYGYYLVNLYKDGKMKTCSIHRLVAEAFIDNINNLPVINHLDGNKLNNNVSNLIWETNAENTLHAVRIGLIKISKGEEHPCSKMTISIANEIRELYKGFKYPQSKLAKMYEVSQTTISDIVNNRRW